MTITIRPLPAKSAGVPDTKAPSPAAVDTLRQTAAQTFRDVRSCTEKLAAPLSAEDQVVQSMPDASPTKWHRAHTTWFFEQFLLVPQGPGYRVFDPRFAFLFNSYYVGAGPRHERPKRGLITRPSVSDIGAYRIYVDAAVEHLLATCPADQLGDVLRIIEIGLNHEQQHQELLLTDILHAFAQSPCAPIYDETWRPTGGGAAEVDESRSLGAPIAGRRNDWNGRNRAYIELPEEIRTIGHAGGGFSFDNEGPAHRVLAGPVRISRSLVTNGEWLAFMHDGGYDSPGLWLSDGWAAASAEHWHAPGYWREVDGVWFAMTLGGLRPIDPAAPVCHVSYYEADAFARWSGRHLPSEAEWEAAAATGELDDAFGVVWQWTRSAYAPYPGFRAPPGAIGEYNGKFMVNQMVLRGSSCATPVGHARLTYRNFFYPPARWQFTGLRLAEPSV
jgi:ergothioneine biosynthesis protein EgtB